MPRPTVASAAKADDGNATAANASRRPAPTTERAAFLRLITDKGRRLPAGWTTSLPRSTFSARHFPGRVVTGSRLRTFVRVSMGNPRSLRTCGDVDTRGESNSWVDSLTVR